MDFMRLIKSIEELLFELVSWLLFYPVTMWGVVRHPIRMLGYAETELKDEVGEQYADALSPPIFLLLSLVLAHLLELLFPAPTEGAILGFFGDDRNLLLFRAITFSTFPLLFALVALRLRGARLTRQTLRPAFYAQCYATAPFVLGIDFGLLLLQHASAAIWQGTAIALLAAASVWYVLAETRWITSAAGVGRLRALAIALVTTVGGCLIVLGVLLAVALSILARRSAG